MDEFKIPLSRGHFAIVDEGDYEQLSAYKWHVLSSRTGPIYAARKITIDGKRRVILMHRLLVDAQPNEKVDHRNGDGLDNRRKNLRPATDQQNQRGFKTPRKGKTSHFRGVHLRKKTGRWISQISINKHVVHIGCFSSEEDAALAYNEYAFLHFGEFAQINNVLNKGGRGVVSPLDRVSL